jgi:hypothetical protein
MQDTVIVSDGRHLLAAHFNAGVGAAVLQHRLGNMVRFWTDKNQRIRVQHILHARFFSGYDPAMTILRMTDDSDAMAML